MVVGNDEAIRRDKRGAAAAQVDDGVERRLGEVGQLLCGELEAERLANPAEAAGHGFETSSSDLQQQIDNLRARVASLGNKLDA